MRNRSVGNTKTTGNTSGNANAPQKVEQISVPIMEANTDQVPMMDVPSGVVEVNDKENDTMKEMKLASVKTTEEMKAASEEAVKVEVCDV